MAKKMLIDATHPEETRVVVVDGNKVDDFDFESINKRQLAGNIYLAKVTRVEPSLQAAFVEYGGNRHGFLAFSEIHPDYYQIPVADREALLEEERREEEARRAREEEGDAQESRPSRKRGRRSRKSARDQNSETDSAAVAGLEVIDIEVPDEPEDTSDDVPRGLEIAEPDVVANDMPSEGPLISVAPVEGEPESTETAEIAEPEAADEVIETAVAPEETAEAAEADPAPEHPADTVPDADEPPEAPIALSSEAPADEGEPEGASEVGSSDEAPQDEEAADRVSGDEPIAKPVPEATDPDEAAPEVDSDRPPRTIAESHGLDDDERVVGDPSSGPARTLTGESTDDAVAEDEAEAEAAESEPPQGPSPDALTGADLVPVEDPSPQAAISETSDDEAVTAVEPLEGAATPVEPATDAEPAGVQEIAGADDEAAPAADGDIAADDQEIAAGDAVSDGPAKDDEPGTEGEAAEAKAIEAEADPAAEEAGDDAEGGRSGRRSRRRRGRNRRGAREAGADEAREETRAGDGEDEADSDDDGPDEPEAVGAEDTLEEAARARTRLRRKYKIQDVVKVRQILLVQVVKEERGNKGAALTTYLSLAGRYCVLMPNTARGGGISRKITNAGDRKRLREIIGEMDVPQGMGLIVRTAGAERTKAEVRRDYEFLLRQWEQIRDLTLKSIAPTLIHEEGSPDQSARSATCTTKDIDTDLWSKGDDGYREAKGLHEDADALACQECAAICRPDPAVHSLSGRELSERHVQPGRYNCKLGRLYRDWHHRGVGCNRRELGPGSTKESSIEETALKTNLEAADEVCAPAAPSRPCWSDRDRLHRHGG